MNNQDTPPVNQANNNQYHNDNQYYNNRMSNSTKVAIIASIIAVIVIIAALIALKPNDSRRNEEMGMSNSYDLSSEENKISYSLGALVAENYKKQGIDLQYQAFSAGAKDAIEGNLQLKDEEIDKIVLNFQKTLNEKQQQEKQMQAQQNQKQSDEFLEKNKAKSGVTTLPSGLQYEVLVPGDSSKGTPKLTDTIKVDYKGSLVDGTEFDSSYKRGEPIEFKLNSVINGWQEALQLMSPGSKWRLFIPAKLAYGENGVGPIGPNQVLIFEVELHEINPVTVSQETTSTNATNPTDTNNTTNNGSTNQSQ